MVSVVYISSFANPDRILRSLGEVRVLGEVCGPLLGEAPTCEKPTQSGDFVDASTRHGTALPT
jgi:hypothetical protein